MSLVKKAGLAGAGGAGRMSLARMPVLLRHMGPVKSSSFRVARRLASSLRYGHAVRDYAEFGACHSIWIVGSDSWIEAAAAELAAAIPLRGKTVILSDAWCDSHASSALRAAGAHTASLNAVEETDHRIFVGEGHPAVDRDPARLESLVFCRSAVRSEPGATVDRRRRGGLSRCRILAQGRYAGGASTGDSRAARLRQRGPARLEPRESRRASSRHPSRPGRAVRRRLRSRQAL